MLHWLNGRSALLTLLAIAFSPFLLRAQFRACPDHVSPAAPSTQKIKITIVSVEFQGENPLSEEARAQLADKIQKSELVASPEQLDQDWLNQIEQTIIGDELRTQGYWRVHTEITPYLLRAAAQERLYSISAAIHSGSQYRLQEIYIANAKVFPPAELRKQIPLYPGDLFDSSKIRDGMDAVRSMYLTQGYIDSVWEAETSVDGDHTHIKVVLKMDEGIQFRVGTVQIFGLDQKTENLLRSLLEPGQIFNGHLLHEFMKENKSLLPADASPAQNIQVQRNTVTGTVDIIIDFRRCSEG